MFTLQPFVTFYVVFFQTDFTTFKIEAMRELTLGANLPLSELNRLPWRYIPGKYKWKSLWKKITSIYSHKYI